MSSRSPFIEIPGHIGPLSPLAFERVREYFEPENYSARPINGSFLEYHKSEMALYFKRVKFNPNFKLLNGSVWHSIRFEYISDTWYRVLCRKSALRPAASRINPPIALYAYTDEKPDDDEVQQVGKTVLGLLELDLSHFYPTFGH